MGRIAESTVRRLSVYLRLLEEFATRGKGTVSSQELAGQGHTTPAQVRKDLSFFGSFGKRGLGYSVPELIAQLRDILGLDRPYRVVVIGAGKIGRALVGYQGFVSRGFHIVLLYDNDRDKVGVSLDGLQVQDERNIEADLAREPADIAIVATPACAVQSLVDRIVTTGIKAILNFAPVQVSHPDEVVVKNVNMALELETLSYALRNR